MSDFIDDRRRALEEAFFARQDAEILRKMRGGDAPDTRQEALSAASGITDSDLLGKLSGLGVDSGTLAALSLVPLVAVAWADGTLEAREREAVLSAAHQSGIDRQAPSYQLLQGWLASAPPPELLTAWSDYIRATSSRLGADGRQALKLQILGRARRVAEAAGGLLGIGAVSAAEQAVLSRLETDFSV
ncbi:hypothetical protein [Muricoccus radiodurans]|uniref:hypothetical protein n=1 Tax=Muricoccus radiodurans TaxID=2231721 RepID=UPI003CF4A405